MQYPKPLSERSIERMYKQAGLSDEARGFLHEFFAACANLYGAISMRDVWRIYQRLTKVPKLRRKDLLAFASIARREENPYFVFEIEELYRDEPHSELERHIVSGELISKYYGKFHLFYQLMDRIDEKPYYLPDDFLSFAKPKPSKSEVALLAFLGGLKSTANECVPKYGETIPNANKGKRLDSFSFLNSMERFDLEWIKRPSAKAAFMKDRSGTEAEKIMRVFKKKENLGSNTPSETLQWFLDELTEVGVQMEDSQMEKLMNLIVDYHNNTNLWCLSGWKPNDLASMHREDRPPVISFGPNLEKAFSKGSIDRDKLIREIQKMGLKVIE
ncbi:MAG: hypothetical protein IJG85_07795 [Eubacteriaceae bacterium]|nr:hypothetical protein [Eubacteriaceae bacterium]